MIDHFDEETGTPGEWIDLERVPEPGEDVDEDGVEHIEPDAKRRIEIEYRDLPDCRMHWEEDTILVIQDMECRSECWIKTTDYVAVDQ